MTVTSPTTACWKLLGTDVDVESRLKAGRFDVRAAAPNSPEEADVFCGCDSVDTGCEARHCHTSTAHTSQSRMLFNLSEACILPKAGNQHNLGPWVGEELVMK